MMSHLDEDVSVTVIATGFEPNSIIEPYKTETKTEKVTPGYGI